MCFYELNKKRQVILTFTEGFWLISFADKNKYTTDIDNNSYSIHL